MFTGLRLSDMPTSERQQVKQFRAGGDDVDMTVHTKVTAVKNTCK